MRPSIARFSDMPGPKDSYGRWWGDVSHGVVKQRGVTQYTLSPFQAKTMPNYVKKWLFNGYRRLSGEAVYFLVPFGLGYGLYTWANRYDAWQNSKAGHLALMEQEGHGEH